MRRSLAWLSAGLVSLAGAGGGLAAGPPPLQHVVVTLKAQDGLSGISGSRSERLQEVIRRRKARADAGYAAFGARLGTWRRNGRVASFKRLWVVNGFAIAATPDVVAALRADPAVASVTPDSASIVPAASGPVEWNIGKIGAPLVWDRAGTGQGVVVATLDTGVDLDHPELAARWRGGTNSWYDPYGQQPTIPTDLTGHGTGVMGVIVGGGGSGTAVGVAPGAHWIAARVFNDQGTSTTSAIHQAFQWLLDPDGDPATPDAPQVVNASWSFANPGCNLEFAPDIQALRAAEILPVFAAGNFGSAAASPANNPGALAVGSTTKTDTIAVDSSRGPSACGEPSTTFPEVSAPGVAIRTTDLGGLYSTQSGTSLAAPHVAGALALLLSARPNLTPADQEAALEQTAMDLGVAGPDNTFGYGRVDAMAALQWAIDLPDLTGPVVSSASVSPSLASAGPAAVTAVAVDAAGTTAAAEWYDGVDPGAGNGNAMTAVDGAFDQAAESVTATIDASALGPGAHTISVRAKDGAGNWGAPETVTLVVDLTGPAVTDLMVTPTPTSGAAAATLAGVATDAVGPGEEVAGAEWFEGEDPGPGKAGAMLPPDGAFDQASEAITAAIDLSGFGPGPHRLSVRARDAAGNWGSAASVILTVTGAAETPTGLAGSTAPATPSPPAGGGMVATTPARPRPPVLGSRTLRLGMRGPDVGRLQRILRGRGLAVAVNGTFGPRTRNAVRLAQRRLHLRATGVADRRFLTRLGIRAKPGANPAVRR